MSSSKNGLMGALALAAVLLYLALIALQVMELSYYRAEPAHAQTHAH